MACTRHPASPARPGAAKAISEICPPSEGMSTTCQRGPGGPRGDIPCCRMPAEVRVRAGVSQVVLDACMPSAPGLLRR